MEIWRPGCNELALSTGRFDFSLFLGNGQVWTHPENFTDVFPVSSLIYLSPDSPNVLQELDVNKVCAT